MSRSSPFVDEAVLQLEWLGIVIDRGGLAGLAATEPAISFLKRSSADHNGSWTLSFSVRGELLIVFFC